MRSARVAVLLLTAAITLSAGCTPAQEEACTAAVLISAYPPAQEEAFKAECVREAYNKSELGAYYVASVIGFAAPVGNPLAVHALAADRSWRSLIARIYRMSGLAPSPFDPVDANRRVEIRRIDETTTHYIFRSPDRPGEQSRVIVTPTVPTSP